MLVENGEGRVASIRVVLVIRWGEVRFGLGSWEG